MKGYYINLDECTDRRKHLEQYVIGQYSFFGMLERFSAIRHENGAIGCGMSHYTILEQELQKGGDDLICVIEDDFHIINPPNFNGFLRDFDAIKNTDAWDIIVFTPRGETIPGTEIMSAHNFNRIHKNQTTTGFIMTRAFASVLAKTFRTSCEQLAKGGKPDDCATAQYWKTLQDKYRFYY